MFWLFWLFWVSHGPWSSFALKFPTSSLGSDGFRNFYSWSQFKIGDGGGGEGGGGGSNGGDRDYGFGGEDWGVKVEKKLV